MTFKTKTFREEDLVLAWDGNPRIPGEAPLSIGDYARWNTGSPKMLVVDAHDDKITVAWVNKDGMAQEDTSPSLCFHRARPLSETITPDMPRQLVEQFLQFPD